MVFLADIQSNSDAITDHVSIAFLRACTTKLKNTVRVIRVNVYYTWCYKKIYIYIDLVKKKYFLYFIQ